MRETRLWIGEKREKGKGRNGRNGRYGSGREKAAREGKVKEEKVGGGDGGREKKSVATVYLVSNEH